MADQADLQRSHRKTRDRSMVLLVVGTVLLMPPVAGIFLIDGMLGGLPIPLLYVFAVWTGLILCTAVLAPLLRDGDDSSRQAGMGEGET